MPDSPVVTRFAPSPTGHLHIGGVRTALFCWAYARRHGGRFVLRIEDTDQKRSSEDAARGILEDLAWLGIAWDDGPEFQVAGLSEPGAGGGADRAETHGSESRATTGSHATLGGDGRGVGPYYQSQRLEIYAEYLDRLLRSGRAYPAFETAEELERLRGEAQGRKEAFRYRRRDDYDHAGALARMRAGEPCVVRLRMPDTPIHVADTVLGEIKFDEEHTDDFVLRKADGFPTYHFAVVVDDELMGVTHVLRGQEHLNNTPRHVALQRALTHEDGSPFRTPVYAHLPLIFNADGSKMSKRDKDKTVRAALRTEPDAQARAASIIGQSDLGAWLEDKTRQLPPDRLVALARELKLELPEIDVEDFRRSGYLPAALCNYLALLGWNPGMKNENGSDLERFDMAFLAQHFSIERIGKSHSKFDREKLAAFNQAALAALAPAVFEGELRTWCERYDRALLDSLGARFTIAARAIQPRVKTLGQCREPIGFALVPDGSVEFDEKAVSKVLQKGEPSGLAILRELRPVLASAEPFEPEAVDAAVKEFCEARGLGMGKVAQPLRVAITGGTVSPGLGETLALVGREGAIARIDRCLARFGPA
ncbi:MAG TPA: glutamate--tRNA ligase [Phycisphaerales bacterium]|nr:glutamate--tRNA ligase [Phycisphaerales bacterium]